MSSLILKPVEDLDAGDPDAPCPVLIVGHADALLGLSIQFGSTAPAAVYDADALINRGIGPQDIPAPTDGYLVPILVSRTKLDAVLAHDGDWPNGTETGFVLFDEINEALLGLSVVPEGVVSVAVYDYEKCLEIFTDQGMTPEDADEWMSFNVIGAYVGPTTPLFASVEMAMRAGIDLGRQE